MNFEVQEEVTIAEFVRVDFFIPELMLIIEVDGPLHDNGLNKMNKKTQMKKMVLEHLGYTVCNINALNFITHQNTTWKENEGEKYIKEQIKWALKNSGNQQQKPLLGFGLKDFAGSKLWAPQNK